MDPTNAKIAHIKVHVAHSSNEKFLAQSAPKPPVKFVLSARMEDTVPVSFQKLAVQKQSPFQGANTRGLNKEVYTMWFSRSLLWEMGAFCSLQRSCFRSPHRSDKVLFRRPVAQKEILEKDQAGHWNSYCVMRTIPGHIVHSCFWFTSTWMVIEVPPYFQPYIACWWSLLILQGKHGLRPWNTWID